MVQIWTNSHNQLNSYTTNKTLKVPRYRSKYLFIKYFANIDEAEIICLLCNDICPYVSRTAIASYELTLLQGVTILYAANSRTDCVWFVYLSWIEISFIATNIRKQLVLTVENGEPMPKIFSRKGYCIYRNSKNVYTGNNLKRKKQTKSILTL